VDEGAPIVALSAHVNRAGAIEEVDVADNGTHAAGGIAALEWLAANLGGGGVIAGGSGARISANDDAQTEEAWEERLVKELEQRVITWSRNKGGGGIDIVGCPDRIQGFHNEWNPPRQRTGCASKRKEKKGEKRKRVAESRPNNISIKEHIEFGVLRRDQRRWRFERADKGGGAVIISRQRWKREASKHVEGKRAYAKANEIEKEFREENLDPKGVRWLEGPQGIIIVLDCGGPLWTLSHSRRTLERREERGSGHQRRVCYSRH